MMWQFLFVQNGLFNSIMLLFKIKNLLMNPLAAVNTAGKKDAILFQKVVVKL